MKIKKSKIILEIPILLLMACQSSESIKNIENCKRLNVGMSQKEISEIMGKPLYSENKYSLPFKESVIFQTYKFDNPMASGGIEIYISLKRDSLITAFCNEDVIK